jgi:hypothetical protein
MDGDRIWQEQLNAFMQSTLAETVVWPGLETLFARQVDMWIRTLSPDEGEAYPEYIEAELSDFLEHELDAGRLDPPSLDELAYSPGLWDVLHGIAVIALEARYTAEVARGVREDMRAPVDDERGVAITEAPRSITEQVQAVLQTINDFVRGRETPERREELER